MNLIDNLEESIKQYPEKNHILINMKETLTSLIKQYNEDINLVFIAEKGAGKTSVICQLLDLTLEVEKINEANKRKYYVEQDVLETGSGATTLSEVVLTQSENNLTKISVVPYSYEECIELLDSFAKMIFNKAHDLKVPYALDTEMQRACRNITGLPEKRIEKRDLALELAVMYDKDDFESFQAEVITRANLEERIKTEFFYYPSKDDEKKWLKKIFRKLNLVHISEAPLPKKIMIEINEELFDFKKLGRVRSIIDTRGLESGSATDRIDIKGLFNDNQNNILIFVDKFNSPSRVLMDLLSNYAYDKDLEIIQRLAYMVNFRDGEPSKVLSCEGIVQSEIEGIEVKKNQVFQNFSHENIYVKVENMIYYNPKRFLNEDGKLIVTEDDIEDYGSSQSARENKQKIRRDEHNYFIKNILCLIESYYETLNFKLQNIEKKYFELIQSLDQNPYLDIQMIDDYIEDEPIIINAVKLVPSMYDEYITKKYASTLMAINNRHGIYYDTDIFCEGANFLEALIRTELKKLKDDILYKLEQFSINHTLNKVQQNNISVIQEEVNKLFFNKVKEINDFFYNDLKSHVFGKEQSDFWSMVKSRWGEGPGYKKDISDFYKMNLVELQYHFQVQHYADKSIIEFKQGCQKILKEYIYADINNEVEMNSSTEKISFLDY